MRKLKRRFSLAYWAFMNPTKLTMLKHDLTRDLKELNSHGRPNLASERAWWYLRYLTFKWN